MDISVQRRWVTPDSTCGEMSVDGEFFCYTLEPRQDQSKGKPYSIPAGRYQVELRMSPRLKYVTPWVKEVPGFEDVLIHIGNYPRDTEGCCLVGSTRMEDFVGNSRLTFVKLMKELVFPVTITYKDKE